MIYDQDFLAHFIELRLSKGEGIPKLVSIVRWFFCNRIGRYLVTIVEKIVSFILVLPIPIYSDFMLSVITYLPGSPRMLGNYLRGLYWSKRLKKMGRNVVIEQGVIIRYPENVELEEFVLIDKNVLLEAGRVKIGKRVHIAENCVISGGGDFIMEDYSCMAHSSAVVTATDTPKEGYRASGPMVPWSQRKVVKGAVKIGKDAFIGMGARILPNVTIGEGAVVASGALVLKDVPSWKIVAGVPAREIGERERVKFPDP